MKRPVLSLTPAAWGLLLTALSGCYSMYGSPYGYPGGQYGGQPYGTPMQTLTPGAQPYTPGMIQPGPVLPNNSTYNNPGLQPTPDNNSNSAPPYYPPAGGNIPVPNPQDYRNNNGLNGVQYRPLQPVTQNPIQPVANNSPQVVPLPANAREIRAEIPLNQLQGTPYNTAPVQPQPLARMEDNNAFRPPISGSPPAVPPAMLNNAAPASSPFPGGIDPLGKDPFGLK